MISYLTEEVRTQFHLLPVAIQIEINEADARFSGIGKSIKILFVDAESSEISIRIDSQLNG